MRIISRRALREFWEAGHADAKVPLETWHARVKGATWNGPQDIKNMFASASFLANDRVVFNIAGNKYRLIILVVYGGGTVYIRFVNTHAEYNKIDASKV